jgi:small subunit ribosomal protein S3
MGQKVNPHGLRVGVIKDWDSRWYASNEKVGDLLVEDKKIRDYLKKTLYSAGVPKIEIERKDDTVVIYLHCSRPGVVIGKGGTEVERIQAEVAKMIGKTVKLNIVEVKNPDMDAQLVAESIAQQLEKRISFRRAMKNAMARAMRAGAKGIKACCSGRLGGAEIARVEHYHDRTIPLQTIRADIDYGFAEAATTYGRIGIKVWIYKGEVLSQTLRTTPRTMDTTKPYQERRDRRPRRDGDRRPGGFNRGGQGGYNRDNRGGQGGYNRGGYNRDNNNGGRPVYSRGPRPAADGAQRPAFNAPRPAVNAPRPAADNKTNEGGAQ